MTDNTLHVIKIGGNVIDDDKALADFLHDFSDVPGPKILVHGGGKVATRLAGELGIETKMIEGRRVTNKAMLDVAVMVYAGLINKRIVAQLQALGINAIGLCGADAGCITSRRRSKMPVDYGEVGDVTAVNAKSILSLISAGMIPVICAITADDSGNLLNTNADTVATETAKAMSELKPTELIYCFEKAGVLMDIDDESSVIESITPTTVTDLINNEVISSGMIPKVTNALNAVTSSDLKRVVIKSSKHLADDSGTKVTR